MISTWFDKSLQWLQAHAREINQLLYEYHDEIVLTLAFGGLLLGVILLAWAMVEFIKLFKSDRRK